MPGAFLNEVSFPQFYVFYTSWVRTHTLPNSTLQEAFQEEVGHVVEVSRRKLGLGYVPQVEHLVESGELLSL